MYKAQALEDLIDHRWSPWCGGIEAFGQGKLRLSFTEETSVNTVEKCFTSPEIARAMVDANLCCADHIAEGSLEDGCAEDVDQILQTLAYGRIVWG